MDVIINNQCADIELTSPVYFTKDAMSYIQFPQQVDSKSSVKIKFKIGISLDTSGGVLLYHLQRKEDTSISTQLLVIWGCKSHPYSCVLLIEHEKTLVWNEDKLKTLYHICMSRYDINFSTEEWLLDDNITLKVKCHPSHGSFEMNIIISEDKSPLCPKKPLWVTSDR
jgi:hypothetical protein